MKITKKENKLGRSPLFVRILDENKHFLSKEIVERGYAKGHPVSTQDTLDHILHGYKELKKDNPKIFEKYFAHK